MRSLLQAWGYNASTSFNGLEAIRAVKSDRYDLAIIDLMMPGMGGRELAPAMKLHCPLMPVILLSAYPPEEVNGVDYIFQKPIEPGTLKAIIEVALNLDK